MMYCVPTYSKMFKAACLFLHFFGKKINSDIENCADENNKLRITQVKFRQLSVIGLTEKTTIQKYHQQNM